MIRQKNMFQTREQDKILGGKRGLDEMEINNIPDKEFKEKCSPFR